MEKKAIISAILIEVLFLLAIITLRGVPERSISFTDKNIHENKTSHKYIQFIPMRDTVFVLDNEYIIIDIREQMAYLHRKHDTTISYKISSGTKNIHKGIKTPTGLFTIQNKTQMARSRQFNNAKLFYWIGFNGNIGFHGLAGSSYYYYLGKKPTSHGCIRISREDGKDLYHRVDRGTPVMVTDTTPARILAFADQQRYSPAKDIILENNNYIHKLIMRERLENLFAGKGLLDKENIFIDGKTILKPHGFKVPPAQKIPDIQRGRLFIPKNLQLVSDRFDHKTTINSRSIQNDIPVGVSGADQ